MDLAVEARDAAGTLLGFAVINGSGTENPYVSNVAVDPAAQGAGVAAKLLQHAGRVRFAICFLVSGKIVLRRNYRSSNRNIFLVQITLITSFSNKATDLLVCKKGFHRI